MSVPQGSVEFNSYPSLRLQQPVPSATPVQAQPQAHQGYAIPHATPVYAPAPAALYQPVVVSAPQGAVGERVLPQIELERRLAVRKSFDCSLYVRQGWIFYKKNCCMLTGGLFFWVALAIGLFVVSCMGVGGMSHHHGMGFRDDFPPPEDGCTFDTFDNAEADCSSRGLPLAKFRHCGDFGPVIDVIWNNKNTTTGICSVLYTGTGMFGNVSCDETHAYMCDVSSDGYNNYNNYDSYNNYDNYDNYNGDGTSWKAYGIDHATHYGYDHMHEIRSFLIIIVVMGAFCLFILAPASAGYLAAIADSLREKRPIKFGDFFSCFKCPYYCKLLLLTLVSSLLTQGGYMLLILPGIWFQLSFMFSLPLHREQPFLGICGSLCTSLKTVHRYFCELLGFMLLLLAINCAGFFAFGVGMLITVPFSAAAFMMCYNHLVGINGVEALSADLTPIAHHVHQVPLTAMQHQPQAIVMAYPVAMAEVEGVNADALPMGTRVL